MKRALLIGLFGLAAATQSFGQGYTQFDNYDCAPYMPILYGHGFGSLEGTGVGSNYHVDLLYQIGTATSTSTMTDAGLNVAIDPTLMDSSAAHNGGYFRGGEFTVPGYVSGPVSFAVEVWKATGQYGGSTYGTSGINGISAIWQESSLATGFPVANYWAGLPGPDGSPLISIELIPEPSIFALSGIGAAALFLTRRRFALKAFGKDV